MTRRRLPLLHTYLANPVAETERAIRFLDTKLQNTYRFMAAKKTEADHQFIWQI
jgi:hypothetical protein